MQAKRGRPWRRIRAAVIEAAPKPLRCYWCNRILHPLEATVDHINALADTGTTSARSWSPASRVTRGGGARRTNAMLRVERPPVRPRRTWPGAVRLD
jgi:hypothetical protein